ncbi:MAG: helix-turn-helix domain-containing protein [Oscillospiraceae bacterium]|nr:helix-turn-helix domain-containing protein [Oscillospiraceae bacterium]
METKEALLELRNKNSLSQDEMAEKLMVTRQAVSRWENGDTVPNTDTLKIISKTFGVSINYLLGQPQNTTCQVCGSPLDDNCYSREQDGSLNDKYCKWCYIDGEHKYHDMEQVIKDVVPRWNWGAPEQMSDWLRKKLVTLDYWKDK